MTDSTYFGALKQAQTFIQKYGNYVGMGSVDEATKEIREFLPIILKKYNIKSIIDAPCGDWAYMKHIDLEGIDYIGYDILPFLIEENKTKYGDTRINFYVEDIIKYLPYGSDLIICRDFLFHLDNDDIKQVIKNIKTSGSKYLLTTSFDKEPANRAFIPFDAKVCKKYGFRRLNLEAEPFNFGKPIEKIYENFKVGCDGRMVGLWKL